MSTESISQEQPRSAIEIVPVGLRVEGKSVLVVGAGPIAARKAQAYVDQGAVVTVVAPEHSPQMDELQIAVRHYRAFEPSDVDGHWFAVTATGIPAVDGAVFAAAEARRVWCNAADDPAHCSVILPAVVRRDDITISISTGGRSPAAASWLRRRIEAMLDAETMTVIDIASRVRSKMRAARQPTEVPGWNTVLDGDAPRDAIAAGHAAALEAELLEAVGA